MVQHFQKQTSGKEPRVYFALMNFHIVNPLQPLSKVPGTAVHGKCLLHNTRAEISMRLAWPGTRALALPERRGKGATEGCTRKKTLIFCQNGFCIAKEKRDNEIR